jgi:hypothetical protein
MTRAKHALSPFDLRSCICKMKVTRNIKRSHFAGGDLTPPLTKGDARPLWKPHNFVPASRGGVNIEFNRLRKAHMSGCQICYMRRN